MAVSKEVTRWLEKFVEASKGREAAHSAYEREQEIKAEKARLKEEKKIKKQQELAEKEKAGFVYLLCSENGFYKIGMAKVVRQRLKDWQRTYPMKITLEHSIACKDRRLVEKKLHDMFSKKRAQYEWYSLDVEDVQYIMSLVDYELG